MSATGAWRSPEARSTPFGALRRVLIHSRPTPPGGPRTSGPRPGTVGNFERRAGGSADGGRRVPGHVATLAKEISAFGVVGIACFLLDIGLFQLCYDCPGHRSGHGQVAVDAGLDDGGLLRAPVLVVLPPRSHRACDGSTCCSP